MSTSSARRKRTRHESVRNSPEDEGKRQRTTAIDAPQGPSSDSNVRSISHLTAMPLGGLEAVQYVEKLTDALHEKKLEFIVSQHFKNGDSHPVPDAEPESGQAADDQKNSAEASAKQRGKKKGPTDQENRNKQNKFEAYYKNALEWIKFTRQEVQLRSILGVNQNASKETIRFQPDGEIKSQLLCVMRERTTRKSRINGTIGNSENAHELMELETVQFVSSKNLQAAEEDFAHSCVCAHGQLKALEDVIRARRDGMNYEIQRKEREKNVEVLSKADKEAIASPFRSFRSKKKKKFAEARCNWEEAFDKLRSTLESEGVEMPEFPPELKELMGRDLDEDRPWYMTAEVRS